MVRVTPEQLSELVGLIYDSALDKDRWPETIRKLSEAFGGPGGIFVQDLVTADASFFVSTLEDKFLASYSEHYAEVNPWLPKVKGAASGTIVLAQNLLRRETYERSEFFNDWMKPQHLYHNSGVIIDNQLDVLTNISFCRGPNDRQFDEQDVALYALLKPHLQRAIAIHRRLFTANLLAGSTLAAFDRLSLGVAIVARDARILFANRALLLLLEQADPLVERAGKLRATKSEVDRLLQRRIVAAVADSPLADAGPLKIKTKTDDSLSFLAVPMSNRLSKALPAVMLFVSDARQSHSPRPNELRALFGLTATEAVLFATLLGGGRLKDYAETRGITLNTARTLLKRLFEKTGKARQADLMRLGWTDLVVRLAGEF